jgi:hypothetical protein
LVKDSPFIAVNIADTSEMITIQVKNSISTPVIISNDMHTTKSEPNFHGRGIKQIKKIVSLANGFLHLSANELEFDACVLLPISK